MSNDGTKEHKQSIISTHRSKFLLIIIINLLLIGWQFVSIDNLSSDISRTEQQSNYAHITQTQNSKRTSPLYLCDSIVKRCAASQANNSTPYTTPNNHTQNLNTPKTLALADPCLAGGYRNQYIRFKAFLVHAIQNNFTQILLPSIRWKSGHGDETTVPHELLFDVDHWNSFHHAHLASNKTFVSLPKMVHYDDSLHPDWNVDTGMFQNTCRILPGWFEQRGKYDVMEDIGEFTMPYGYGGGYGVGNLWKKQIGVGELSHHDFDRIVSRALKLSDTVMKIVANCTSRAHGIFDKDDNNSNYPKEGEDWEWPKSFMALHARLEPDMLLHRHSNRACQPLKVRSAQFIFDQIASNFNSLSSIIHHHHNETTEKINDNHNNNMMLSSIFVAIDRDRMAKDPMRFKDQHEKNVEYLRNLSSFGLRLVPSKAASTTTTSREQHQTNDTNGNDNNNSTHPQSTSSSISIPIFECGRDMASNLNPCMQDIVGSIINFEMAVHADVFLGTQVSSWSSDVWNYRYYKGGMYRRGNFEFRPEGIMHVDHPVVHHC